MSLISINDLLLAIRGTVDPFQPNGIIQFDNIKILWDRIMNVGQWAYNTRVHHAWKMMFDIEDINRFAIEIRENIGQDVRKVSIKSGDIERVIYDYKSHSWESKYCKMQDEIRSSIDLKMIEQWLMSDNNIILYYGSIPRFRIERYKIIKELGDSMQIDDSNKSGGSMKIGGSDLPGCYMKVRTRTETLPYRIPIDELLDNLIMPDMARVICNSKEKIKKELENFPEPLIIIILGYVF